MNVNKPNLNINTAALATFEVVSGSHVVGLITGSGTTQIDNGASMTAKSTSQNALIIGTIIAGESGETTVPVPEPAEFVLLAGAFVLLAVFYRLKAIGCSDCVKSQGN
jgi:hypothetical protein